MGSFYIINTFMKSFKQFIKEATPPTPYKLNKTAETIGAMTKFGSGNRLKRVARGAGTGRMGSAGLAGRRT